MWWLIIGLVLGVAGLWLASWARSKNVSIKWYAWIPIVLAVLLFALAAMDYSAMIAEQEPTAAGFVLGFYGIPGLVLALIAGGLVWWQNKKPAVAAKKS
jgi:hypothetical protein